jgi:1,4-dihydroxy-2-naphthoyl-CoA hydrolase
VDPRSSLLEGTFDALYGLEVLSCDEEEIRAQVPVRDELKQTTGWVHNGLYAAMAESMASMATALAVERDGRIAAGLGNATSFVRPITEGTVHALARRRHRGRTTWVWDVQFTDDAGRLCATARMTIAVREASED